MCLRIAISVRDSGCYKVRLSIDERAKGGVLSNHSDIQARGTIWCMKVIRIRPAVGVNAYLSSHAEG